MIFLLSAQIGVLYINEIPKFLLKVIDPALKGRGFQRRIKLVSCMHLYDTKVSLLNSSPASSSPLPNLRLMGFDYLWPDCTGQGVVVAVIDSGCDMNHPDLKSNVIGGRNFVPGRPVNEIQDENGHGTHVAGIIAANGKIKGGAIGAKLLILKVFDASGQCDLDRIVQAIDYATSWRGLQGERVSIINMSLGGPEHSPALETAVNKAVSQGILVVCAAGNSGDGKKETLEIDYPAAFEASLSVGAVDLNLGVCYFTDTNNQVDVAAPGADIVSTYPGNRYASMSGTSMACPHVSAFAACMIEKFSKRGHRLPTASELRMVIQLMTLDVGDAGIDLATGAGFVSALPDVSLLKRVVSLSA